jgi:hypothetical protein
VCLESVELGFAPRSVVLTSRRFPGNSNIPNAEKAQFSLFNGLRSSRRAFRSAVGTHCDRTNVLSPHLSLSWTDRVEFRSLLGIGERALAAGLEIWCL